MSSSSEPFPYFEHPIVMAAMNGDVWKMKEIMDEIGNEMKFRSMCDSIESSLGYNALYIAVANDEFKPIQFLVERVGVDLDVKSINGITPLISAVNGGNLNTAKYLIEQGADVTVADFKGSTALHYAVINDNKELMKLLLRKGADINADSVHGTPLTCAVQSEKPNIVKYLLKHKAKPNLVSKYLCTTPLISAVCNSKNIVEIVELLLKAGADPNISGLGLSPLAHALEKNQNDCIGVLLAAGADVDLVNPCGLLPIEHAAFGLNLDAIFLLIGARPRILSNPYWNYRNMMKKMISYETLLWKDIYLQRLRQMGDDKCDEKDYSSAVELYTEVAFYNGADDKLLANRSLCWACLGEGAFALCDAEMCVQQNPDCAKTHLREAIAWHLLELHQMSSKSFKTAYELTPENENID